MQRRRFLGALGAVIAGGPKTVAKAIPVDTAGLSLPNLGVSALGRGLGESYVGSGPVSQDNSYAVDQLAMLKKLTPWAKKLRYQRTTIYQLDPDTASLRSVSLGAKMRISKRVQFERDMELEKGWLEGVIAGVVKW